MANSGDCLFVEGNVGVSAKPAPFVIDYSVGKVGACCHHRKASFLGTAIEDDIGRIAQQCYCGADVLSADSVATP